MQGIYKFDPGAERNQEVQNPSKSFLKEQLEEVQ